MSSDNFINEIIEKQRQDGLKIVNHKLMPTDIQQKIWQFAYSLMVIPLITPNIRINWNYGRSEKLKLLLAKTDDPGILQIGYTDFQIDNTEYYTTMCQNCAYYRFPCLNCHYYVYPTIESSMWKHPLNSEPRLPFRLGKVKPCGYSAFELL